MNLSKTPIENARKYLWRRYGRSLTQKELDDLVKRETGKNE